MENSHFKLHQFRFQLNHCTEECIASYTARYLFIKLNSNALANNSLKNGVDGSIGPESPLRLGALGFHLSLYGDWERGKQILDSVMHGHMEYPRYFHGAIILFYYRDNSYELALKEAKKYKVPGFFWGPMFRAMLLGQLSRKEEAQTEVQHLRQMKPDFEKRARYLISRFVKEESLVEHIVDGLQKAGLDIQ